MSEKTNSNHALLFLYKQAIKKIEHYKGLPWKFNIIYIALTAFIIHALLSGTSFMITNFLYLIFVTYIGFGVGVIGITRQAHKKIDESCDLLKRIRQELGKEFNDTVGSFDLGNFDKSDKVVSYLSTLVPIACIVIYSVVYLKFILGQ